MREVYFLLRGVFISWRADEMPITDADALTRMGKDAAKKSLDYFAAGDPTGYDPAKLASILSEATSGALDSQKALAASHEMLGAAKNGATPDEHAAIITKHLKQCAGGTSKMSKLTKEQREKLDAADFGDPDRKLFPILDQSDIDATAHLIGKAKDPDRVKSRVRAIAERKGLKCPEAWEAQHSLLDEPTFSIEFSLDAAGRREDGDHVVLPAPVLFRCDDYPDKNFSLSPEEAEFSVIPSFPAPGVELDLEHKPTVLSGKLGRLTKVFSSPNDPYLLSGETRIPKWLDALLGPADRKLSVAFDRTTKNIIGCGLVRNPRVSDAAMMAAFARSEVDVPAAVPAPGQTAPSEIEKLQADLAAARAGREAEFAGRIAAEAVQFADGEILSLRKMPRERDALIAQYVRAAKDDASSPAQVDFSGEKVSRVEHLKRSALLAEPHKLTEEQLKVTPDGVQALFNFTQPTGGTNTADGPISEQRRKELLAKTQLGRTTADRMARR